MPRHADKIAEKLASRRKGHDVLHSKYRAARYRAARMLAVAAGGMALLASSLVAAAPAATAERADPQPTKAAGPRTVHVPVPSLHWTSCHPPGDRAGKQRVVHLQCAEAKVPMDYDHPYGAKVTLALARERASHPGERIGSLFVNPGGPGGSAREFVPYAARHLGKHVRQRFDVVGIDPRGVGASARLVCHDPTPQNAPPSVNRFFPYTPREINRRLRFDAYLRHLCATHSRPILDHMSTADTARDMNLIRRALGGKKLNYYGISYGTYLGATYAAMFPRHIRAMVVDGVLDPVAWATGRHGNGTTLPFSSRVRSGKGAWLALTSAFAECDRVGKDRCPLSGDASRKWHEVVHRLKKGPVKFGHFTLHYSDVVGIALGALYSRGEYRPLMRLIGAVHKAIFGTSAARAAVDPVTAYKHLKAMIRSDDVTRPYGYGRGYNLSSPGVFCSDSLNPSRPRAWVGAAQLTDHRSPWFGAAWTWISSICARWPGSSADAFRGPFKAHPSAPVLIVGNIYDPATPISGARRLNGLLAGSRLLTLNGWGHGALGQSQCTTNSMQRYLVRRVLPIQGKVCKPNKQLFPKRAG
jgi:pimeloyl-ACP methyl ester carboxylesterase